MGLTREPLSAGERLPPGRKGQFGSPEGRTNVNIGFRYTNNCNQPTEPKKGKERRKRENKEYLRKVK